MTQTEFVYTTYIRTSPEQLWRALTDPVFTPALLGHRHGVRLEGRVHQSNAAMGPRPGVPTTSSRSCSNRTRTGDSHTGGTTTNLKHAEMFRMVRATTRRAPGAKPLSKVTFDIEQLGDHCQSCSSSHDDFVPDSEMLRGTRRRMARHTRQSQDPARDRRHPPSAETSANELPRGSQKRRRHRAPTG